MIEDILHIIREYTIENWNVILLLAGFALIAVSANQIARIFQKINLPFITGLLFIGIIAGPFVLNLIPSESREKLYFINEVALAFIAFAAGGELYLNELRNRFNSIKWVTISQMISTMVIGTTLLLILVNVIPIMSDKSLSVQIAMSMLAATIFVARSPASAIAIINELRAKGPFTQTILGVTVLADFLVIIVFGVAISLSETLVLGEKFNLLAVFILFFELGLSVLFGYILSKILELILSLKTNYASKIFLTLLVGYLVFVLAHWVKTASVTHLHNEIYLEPLLICIIASVILTNYSKYRAEFLRIINDTGPIVYIAFFTLTGASIFLDVFLDVWVVALLFFVIRFITMVIGSFTGGILARDPRKYNYVSWMPYITQAGVGLGLATVVAIEFPEWGNEFATIIISVIVINQLVGPPLFKWAFRYVGEDHSRGDQYVYNGAREAIIFGLESQSIALARQLVSSGWKAQIVTLDPQKKDSKIDGIEVRFFDRISIKNMNNIEADKTEAIIAMLTDNENYRICELAYENYGTKDLIVLLNDRINFDKFHRLGALIVDPATAMVSLLDHFVRSPQAATLLLGMQPDQDTRDIEMQNPNLHGIPLRKLRLPSDIIILSVQRGGQMIISHGYTRLRLGDVVTLVGSLENLDNISLRFERP
ncbi:cation:proton antiporter [Bacteroidota bacterium]